jgi:hypothetical protein
LKQSASRHAFAPFLTEKDEKESSEGGIDPLGTEPLADALAMRLALGVRERQRHPRFLTAMAVSLSLCDEFGDEVVASDGVTPAWLVFEWYVVEGLVRTRGQTPKDIQGLPGRDKAGRALADHVPLSARRYLKNPTVTGFHGAFWQLASALGIEQGERLGGRGFDLLEVWAKDQALGGFVGTGDGRGKGIRQMLKEALRLGLAKAAVARTNGWEGWGFFSDHLAPYEFGRCEKRFLWDALMEDTVGCKPETQQNGAPFRREVLSFLVSDEGRRLWRQEVSSGSFSERVFHEALRPRASADLRRLLLAIDIYERFARLAQDAFDDCLYEMTRKRGMFSATELGRLASVKEARQRLPKMFGEIMDRLEPFAQALRFQQTFALLSEASSAGHWVERLMEHHRKTQKQKPPKPDGKMTWWEGDGSGYIIRPIGHRDEPAPHDGSYVHFYRTIPLWSFASDLRKV